MRGCKQRAKCAIFCELPHVILESIGMLDERKRSENVTRCFLLNVQGTALLRREEQSELSGRGRWP